MKSIKHFRNLIRHILPADQGHYLLETNTEILAYRYINYLLTS